MRLDKFLQATGVFKRRAAVKEACGEGRVLVNEGVARAGKEVLPGQMIEIEAGRKRLRVEVLRVPLGNVAKGERWQYIRVFEQEAEDAEKRWESKGQQEPI